MEIIIRALVNGLVVPVTSVITFLVSSGILLLVFAALWVAFGLAIVRSQSILDAAWRRVRALPLPLEGLAWLLFLPLLVGLAIRRRSWPIVARATVIAGIAGWNLLAFLPRPA